MMKFSIISALQKCLEQVFASICIFRETKNGFQHFCGGPLKRLSTIPKYESGIVKGGL